MPRFCVYTFINQKGFEMFKTTMDYRPRTTMLFLDGPIDTQLAMLRADVDQLARCLGHEYGEDNEAASRAEQLSGAIQRLEWALQRQGARRRPAAAAACA